MVDTGISSSFIPHDTSVAPSAARRVGGLNDLLLLCSAVLLVASVALAIGVFLYGQYLVTENAKKVEEVNRANNAVQPELIQTYTRLDDRMKAAESVLAAHIAPSIFFQALQQTTLQTVSFQSLDFQVADSQNLSIKMVGVAESVNSIALQADLFSKNGVITSPIFSNIARQADGVHFNLAAVVNPSKINYVKAAAGGGALNAVTLPANNSPFEGLPQETSVPAAESPSPKPNN